MCGIVGYTGPRQALPLILEGLGRLEYRGYDSAGVAVLDGSGVLHTAKKAGVLSNLETYIDSGAIALEGTTGMGHTRWATHGGPTDRNAHPHTDTSGKTAVIHNGIIENFPVLRAELEHSGIELTSDTDTEVVAHLLGAAFAAGPTAGDLPASMAVVCRRLEGAFTLVAAHADVPDTLVAARRNSPLVIGVGQGEMFVASDVAAFISHTRDAIELGQDQMVVITPTSWEVTSFRPGESATTDYRPFRVDWDLAAAEKGGHEFFMDKEIQEQPQAVEDTLRGHFDGTRIVLDEQRLGEDELRTIDKVFVVACGSSYHSGLVAKYAIEHWTRLPVEVELASEFRYRDPVLDRDTLVVAITQSGETADVLEAVRHARRQRARVLAVCNTNGSQIPRESDAVVYTHAGPEVGVASTKCFLAQITANLLVGLALAQARGTKYADEVAREYEALLEMPAAVAETLTLMDPVRQLGRDIADSKAVLFLGRHVGFPVALEGALKLKELAYMHAEGFAAGELKHGPIALVEDGLPVVVVTPSPKSQPLLHSKLLSNIREIQARGARTIVIGEEGDETIAPFADTLIELPRVPALLQPLVATVPLQILAAEIARTRGYDIDKPRNLAKSVTVE
ncbi:glucosamine--fructose-6-phosphate aminotransferase (isomerizing) [Nakamurella panacisegetis]|uniref:Glutamine--fructose-6-phosphate aminotransferase [isomerizing] n=1 Tax=Nakamurella panacisegetis TaxID=1090615 RepID=A0A1H0P2E1_9ACTN|nr:glutamine--fructose-6-phosphate transaminase (isomerizing) [Nakamurella panacisegetis]SDO99182.1 glucosamine--fructose-6-phosphate aminotransferase (isomerizing) [Nakamurella panacisegetis]